MNEPLSGNSSEIFHISGATVENTVWSFNDYDTKINVLEADQAFF